MINKIFDILYSFYRLSGCGRGELSPLLFI